MFHESKGLIGVYNKYNISNMMLVKNMDHILEEMFPLKS